MRSDRRMAKTATRWRGARAAMVGLTLAWIAAAASTLLLPEAAGRFLDLPLGAYLAAQGALVAMVVLALSLTASGATRSE